MSRARMRIRFDGPRRLAWIIKDVVLCQFIPTLPAHTRTSTFAPGAPELRIHTTHLRIHTTHTLFRTLQGHPRSCCLTASHWRSAAL